MRTFSVFLPFLVLVNKYGCSEEFDQGQLQILYSEEPERWNAGCQKYCKVEIQETSDVMS
jgi:hypothetical protein